MSKLKLILWQIWPCPKGTLEFTATGASFSGNTPTDVCHADFFWQYLYTHSIPGHWLRRVPVENEVCDWDDVYYYCWEITMFAEGVRRIEQILRPGCASVCRNVNQLEQIKWWSIFEASYPAVNLGLLMVSSLFIAFLLHSKISFSVLCILIRVW